MRLHDPARPRDQHDTPLYVWSGVPIAAIPDLSVYPQANGRWYVSTYLKLNGTPRLFTHETRDFVELTALLLAFEADPEATFAKFFGYQGPHEGDAAAPSDVLQRL